jgi:hypothetical protein
VTLHDLDASFVDWIDPGKREGLEFRCPHCQERLRIFFENPSDGKPRGANPRWTIVGGSGLGDLTLRPSVQWLGHCHVHITDGQVVPA